MAAARQVIPDAAVEAAARVMQAKDRSEGFGEYELHEYTEDVTTILEAAAPHILREAKREAWEEGYTAADCDAPHAGKTGNPYESTPQRFEAFPAPRGPWTAK